MSAVMIFDDILYALTQINAANKAMNTHEIAALLGLHLRSAQRLAKDLVESGWLDSSKRIGNNKMFSVTEKTKKLVGVEHEKSN